jgi:hypothetical protein
MSTSRSLRDLTQQSFSARFSSLTAPPLPGALPSFGHVARSHAPIVLTLVATAAAIYAGVVPIHAPHAVVTMTAVFAGALVAGLAGFAFSAIAGAILFHWLPPVEAVPLLLACSITTQVFGIARLWRAIRWRDCAPYVLGGMLGIPLGACLLARLDADVFVASFGVFLIAYSTWMTFRPNLAITSGGRALEGVAGFLGGITGGATAFPGAIPTIWCNARGFTKLQQRGIVRTHELRHVPAGDRAGHADRICRVRPHRRSEIQADHAGVSVRVRVAAGAVGPETVTRPETSRNGPPFHLPDRHGVFESFQVARAELPEAEPLLHAVPYRLRYQDRIGIRRLAQPRGHLHGGAE